MVSLKREVSNGKIALEFVLTALPVLQVEIQVKSLQNLAYKKMAPELNEVLSQSVKIFNYIKTVL